MLDEVEVKKLAELLLAEVLKSPDGWVDYQALARKALEFCEERADKKLRILNELTEQHKRAKELGIDKFKD